MKHINSSLFELKNHKLFLSPKAVVTDNDGRWKMFDLSWEATENAKSYTITIVDYEASRVIGQPFIHFAACNIKNNQISFGENLTNSEWVQGVNSTVPGQNKDQNGVIIPCMPKQYSANSLEEATGYFPPMPPDKKHLYTIKIYALDVEKLDLKQGFHLGELNNAMLHHVLDVKQLNFWYEPEGK
ncbi:YbhB/YbcL family Raf kinase inhibitor-like protein [Mycoplasma corogypsi]|uniref:YbhB/YbcL family Raf kinase inhibitor-like protein n=1 Tax=Mycoplasma corogypsi TaxID=2106 RepID=UPI003872EC6D